MIAVTLVHAHPSGSGEQVAAARMPAVPRAGDQVVVHGAGDGAWYVQHVVWHLPEVLGGPVEAELWVYPAG